MLRGIITGLFFGGVLGLMLAGVVSLLAPLPSNVATPQTSEPTTSAPVATENAALPAGSDTDAPVNADSVAQAPAAVDGTDGAPVADRSSAPKPDAASVEGAPVAPQENGVVDLAVNSESPVLPNPQANPIARPGEDTEPSISVDPAQPLSPTTVDTQAFEAPTADTGSDTQISQTDSAPDQSQPVVSNETVSESAPVVDSTVAELPSTAPAEEETASFLKPATELKDTFEQHTSTRLPIVNAESTAAETTEVIESASEMVKPPLAAFAAAFEAEADKPLMSIVLLDDAAVGIDLATLASFPLPLSVAVNAQSAGAAERAAALRAQGLEVLAVMNFPEGATVSDVAVNIEGQLANVPEAVALMDGFDGGVQETRAVADQVISYALESGHGVVFQPKGLNTAQKLAVREGVGAVTVFRDFDGAGQSEVVIRRFLDQAAFKARQNEAVLMLGRLQEGTIAALASWALQDRASTVSIAPVSALLAQTVQ